MSNGENMLLIEGLKYVGDENNHLDIHTQRSSLSRCSRVRSTTYSIVFYLMFCFVSLCCSFF